MNLIPLCLDIVEFAQGLHQDQVYHLTAENLQIVSVSVDVFPPIYFYLYSNYLFISHICDGIKTTI